MEARWSVAAKLAGTDEACAETRALLRIFLAGWNRLDLLDDASVVLNELVANAVRHGSEGEQIDISLDGDAGGRLLLTVFDQSEEPPVLHRPLLDADGGRGLILVNGLSNRWGVEPGEDHGKAVWAELR